MVSLYIEHVATCICLRNLEKREFKMWRGTLFKKKNPGNVMSLRG